MAAVFRAQGVKRRVCPHPRLDPVRVSPPLKTLRARSAGVDSNEVDVILAMIYNKSRYAR